MIISIKNVIHLYKPAEENHWSHSYAQVPNLYVVGNKLHVFFSTREKIDKNKNFKSYIGKIELDLTNHEIDYVSSYPLLPLGTPGTFDEFGTMPGSVYTLDGKKYFLYYCGWTRQTNTPYKWSIGVSSSTDLRTFSKIYEGPIIPSTHGDSLLQACPYTYSSGKDMKMIYLSGKQWVKSDKRFESIYTLKCASSRDGLNWEVDSKEIIDPKVNLECQTSPSIFEFEKKTYLLFSYRNGLDFRTKEENNYRLGLCIKDSKNKWQRVNLKVEFEKKTEFIQIAYAQILKYDKKYYIFFNKAEKFGADGIYYSECHFKEEVS